jgi:transposase
VPVQLRRVNRGALPKHLPRHEVVIEPEEQICPCRGGAMHRIGEDIAERLEVIPAQFRVIVAAGPNTAAGRARVGWSRGPRRRG